MKRLLIAIAGAALLTPAVAQDAGLQAKVEATIKSMFASADTEWQKRVTQDETQKICSHTRGEPSAAEAARIVAREKATIRYPADKNVMGDWKKGEKVAQTGTGGQFSDTPETFRGGNCYACHQLAKSEVSYGTLGPSLAEYGKIRKFDPKETLAAYEKIYNSQSVLACSMMPRFGYHEFLSIEQIRDVSAYLMSPDSPVNK